jgi:hypothetical protein
MLEIQKRRIFKHLLTRGHMKYLSIIITTILLLTTSLFLVAAATDDIIKKGTQDYLKDFINKKGITSEKVGNITEVKFTELPKEVSIENIDDTNIAIYEIGYEEGQIEKQVFVITYSVEQLKTQGDLIIAHDKRQFLNFGYNGEMTASGFLNTATGVSGDTNKGYLMMREGSITGISTNLEITKNSPSQIEIIIYKNGKAVKFSNTISARNEGIEKDYDIQSSGIVRFSPGDLISVYLQTGNEVLLKDAITLVEITTTN